MPDLLVPYSRVSGKILVGLLGGCADGLLLVEHLDPSGWRGTLLFDT